MSNFNSEEDYNYVLTNLARLISLVGGDEEQVETITLDELYSLINVAYPNEVADGTVVEDMSEAERIIRRQNYRCSFDAKRFTHFRDLYLARSQEDA